jgi:hypothetical protein
MKLTTHPYLQLKLRIHGALCPNSLLPNRVVLKNGLSFALILVLFITVALSLIQIVGS